MELAHPGIAFWPKGNCFSTAGLVGGLHFGCRPRLGIAFWPQGNIILAKAKGMLIVFAACGLILSPVD